MRHLADVFICSPLANETGNNQHTNTTTHTKKSVPNRRFVVLFITQSDGDGLQTALLFTVNGDVASSVILRSLFPVHGRMRVAEARVPDRVRGRPTCPLLWYVS